jgi:tetratricopeptide (TPR) repeat protein
MKKIEEANALMKEGEKLITKTLFRWKPDWESACTLFEKAANLYKNAKSYNLAKEAFKKASLAQYNSDIIFTAAKDLESAASMAKEDNQLAEAIELYEKAAQYFMEDGNSEKASENLIKAAKIVEESNSEKAYELAVKACDLLESDEKEIFATEVYKYLTNLLIKSKKFDKLIEHLKRQLNAHQKLNHHNDVAKMVLSLIIIHLYRDDYVAADREYQDSIQTKIGFLGTPEASAANELLNAFEKRDNEALKKCTSKQIFNFLDQPIIRIARNLHVNENLGDSDKQEEEGLA